MIGVGSCFEYDTSAALLCASSLEMPNCLYAKTKLALKNIAEDVLKGSKNHFNWARLFFLYGDNEKPDRLYPQVVNAVKTNTPLELTDGNQIRDFLNVNTAGEMLVDLLSTPNSKTIYNVCSGNPLSVKDFVTNVAGKNIHLMQFGKRKPNLVDPPSIVGVPGF